mmetsp:Transcript_96818/g.278562  ORF Transcript_96818/g.278562 Transcript_96818/m.278562 type:complete len:218 (-) Transcript_96818:63-716(-)
MARARLVWWGAERATRAGERARRRGALLAIAPGPRLLARRGGHPWRCARRGAADRRRRQPAKDSVRGPSAAANGRGAALRHRPRGRLRGRRLAARGARAAHAAGAGEAHGCLRRGLDPLLRSFRLRTGWSRSSIRRCRDAAGGTGCGRGERIGLGQPICLVYAVFGLGRAHEVFGGGLAAHREFTLTIGGQAWQGWHNTRTRRAPSIQILPGRATAL